MYEVEIKIETDHGPVRDQLRKRGATETDHRTQIDTYYNAPHRDFAETDEALRIRREKTADSETNKVTYKGPLIEAESKTRLEHETIVADGNTLDQALQALGFTPAATVEKERTFYEIDGYTITLDSVSELGEFVEIETEAEAAAIEAAREGATELLTTLGLDASEQIRTSYLGMLLEPDTK
ncbi:class IV adenylate cyclase [Natronocalculus amylovorans]|uniref:Class IV adenylate cyclase n=1 Tax=Natronocalculus amylovorans TaxID=2917812 RepID=A0AAE3K995_9EURY|nr:class IV adenylate cyclase [Natronocalculus amylovorans]MCL9817330.1 class IV adenylate cyclase [Natronocalculus amylovorans]NUE02643.1 class IV adenylate cyclase [Halorubraceae archaeon YAN]